MVERSVNLLNSLSSERVRWDETNESFKSQMNTIIGDCLLNSAFMSYAGYYDQGMRLNLFNQWKRQLIESDIQFRKDISRTEVHFFFYFSFQINSIFANIFLSIFPMRMRDYAGTKKMGYLLMKYVPRMQSC